MEKATALVTLVNSADRIRHAHGYRETNVVRSMSVSVVVSPSIALPVITESIAWRLGLTEDGTVAIRMGEKRITVAMVRDLEIEIFGRRHPTLAVVMPGENQPAVGMVFMQSLDLIVDAATRFLRPRDPDIICTEIE